MLNEIVVDAEQIEELGQIRRVPFALQIGLGESDVAAVEKPRRKAIVVKRHTRRRTRLDAAEPQRTAIR